MISRLLKEWAIIWNIITIKLSENVLFVGVYKKNESATAIRAQMVLKGGWYLKQNDAHFHECGDQAISGGWAHACLCRAAQHHNHAWRVLVGSYKGNKILLGTPLLNFYLDEGLVVSHVHWAVQCRSHPWLESFADFVSTLHCAADADSNQKILGEMAKLVGNVGFGRFIMDVACHQEVKYDQDDS